MPIEDPLAGGFTSFQHNYFTAVSKISFPNSLILFPLRTSFRHTLRERSVLLAL